MDTSPLSKLPAEMRVKIFEFALQLDGPVELLVVRHKSKNNGVSDTAASYALGVDNCRDQRKAIASQLKTLTACKQIHHEGQPIFFAINSFSFITTILAGRALEDRLAGIQRAREVITAWYARLGSSASRLGLMQVECGQWLAYDVDDYHLVNDLPRILAAIKSIFKGIRGRLEVVAWFCAMNAGLFPRKDYHFDLTIPLRPRLDLRKAANVELRKLKSHITAHEAEWEAKWEAKRPRIWEKRQAELAFTKNVLEEMLDKEDA